MDNYAKLNSDESGVHHQGEYAINTILCNDICQHINNTCIVHNDRHNNISEHKTTRINDSHCKLELKKVRNSAYLKYCPNMRHTSLC